MSYEPDRPFNVKNYFAKKRKIFLNSALRTDARPISIEALEALKENGELSTETFKDNVGKIFPLVLERLSLGDSIPMIERFLGMKTNSLSLIVQRHPRLKKACNEARKIKTDRPKNLPQ